MTGVLKNQTPVIQISITPSYALASAISSFSFLVFFITR